MDDRRISQLSQMAQLRDSGVLSDAEFEAQKARLLRGGPRWPLYVGAGVLAAITAAGAGVWTMRDTDPVAEPVSPRRAAQPTPAPTPSPTLAVRTPQQDLGDAFLAATGHAGAFTTLSDGETITTSPIRIVALPFGRALLTRTETKDGCHACAGYIGVHYLRERDGTIVGIARSFPQAVQGWAWGAAPDFEMTTRFTANPAIYASGSDMHQGYAESGAILTELTPTGPVKSDLIDTGSDNSGAITEESMDKTCSVTGKIANIVRDRSFDVAMTGTAAYRLRYAKVGGRFVALDKGARSCV